MVTGMLRSISAVKESVNESTYFRHWANCHHRRGAGTGLIPRCHGGEQPEGRDRLPGAVAVGREVEGG